MGHNIKLLSRDVIDTVLPRFCCVCGRRLMLNENTICVNCLDNLPLTHIKGKRSNVVERLFWDDKICARRANSFMYYEPESPYSRIFFKFKYYKQPKIAVAFGRMMAQDLSDTDFFEGIDFIMPVPLSKERQKKRGYNQSEKLARGISEITGLRVECESIERTIDNPTQTRLQQSDRIESTKSIFRLARPELASGKHVLIVDDTITTGSTIRSLAHTLSEAGNVSMSILSLGVSTWHRDLPHPSEIYPGWS